MPDPLLHKNLLKVVLGNYMVGPATSIADPSLLPEIQQYKRLVASQLIPLARHDIARKIPDGPLLISRKIDGEFNALIYKNGELFTVNPGGTVRVGLPFFPPLEKLFATSKIKSAIFAGELHADLGEQRSRVHDALSILRHPKDNQQLERIRFAVFDIIMLNDDRISTSYSQTWSQIIELGLPEAVGPVETVTGSSTNDVDRQFQKWVDSDASEGVVVRSDAAGSYKIKPLFTLDVVIIGFTESTDERTGLVHDVLVAVRRRDGALHVLGRVGGGFSEEHRRTMLSDLQDLVVDSEYAEVNSDHVAYQMVRPEIVIEISCLDLVAQNTRGRPVNRMTLNWDKNEQIYKVIRRLPLVSVISPQFLRFREDKSADNCQDTRIQQLDDIVPIPLADADTTELSLPKSQLMQREVYVKTLRGEQLVRKFLLWRTNKEGEGDSYPAFVAYHADYSPSRKVPLTREVRVSSSETQILALWHQLKEENIKAGWELHNDKAAEAEKIVADAIEQAPLNSSAKTKKTKTTKKKAAKKKAVKKKTAEASKTLSPKKKKSKKKT